MKARIRAEVEFVKSQVEGNSDKMENPLSEEIMNVEALGFEMKRISLLKQTRDYLERGLKGHLVLVEMRNELLKQLNSKKVDLAIERNEVEELAEAATLRDLQDNKFAVRHKQSVLDISSNMLNMSIMTKKKNFK
jgi:hypothetical protein